MKTYEIRNAFDTDFGGNYEHYYDNIALKARSRQAATIEAQELQECHDANHVAQFGHDESFNHAPCYASSIYEFDQDGNAERIEL